MRVVYVSDNRVRGNYGCRATSTALSQLVSKNNKIVGRVTGRYTNWQPGPLFFSRCLPAGAYKTFSRMPHWDKTRAALYQLHRVKKRGMSFFFSKFDFVSLDLDKSIDNLVKCLPANEQIREYDLRQYDFDALVVNGEGSFIFATPAWRESVILLMLMHWAQRMGKKVFFVNAMFSGDPYSDLNEETIAITRSVLSKAELVTVRENESFEFARRHFPDIEVRLVPDALFSWYDYVNDEHVVENGRYYMGHSTECDFYYDSLDFTKPYICVSGSSAKAIGTNRAHAIDLFTELALRLKDELGMNVFLVDVCEGDEFLEEVGANTGIPVIALDTPILAAAKILANAALYVSGRYHPGIMASLGGTPCVFMSSNSHKTHSLQQLLEYQKVVEYPIDFDASSLDAIISESKEKILQGEALRETIRQRCYKLRCSSLELAGMIGRDDAC